MERPDSPPRFPGQGVAVFASAQEVVGSQMRALVLLFATVVERHVLSAQWESGSRGSVDASSPHSTWNTPMRRMGWTWMESVAVEVGRTEGLSFLSLCPGGVVSLTPLCRASCAIANSNRQIQFLEQTLTLSPFRSH